MVETQVPFAQPQRRALTELIGPSPASSAASSQALHALDHLRQQQRLGRPFSSSNSSSEDDCDENLTPTSSSSRHKSSLAFILTTADSQLAASATTTAAPTLQQQLQQRRQQSLLSSARASTPLLPPLSSSAFFHPGASHALSRLPTTSTSITMGFRATAKTTTPAMAVPPMALSSHTPTSERAKMKRRRTTSNEPDSSRRSPPASGSSQLNSEPDSVTRDVSNDNGSPTAAKKGSKFCVVEGCSSRAKHARKCWKHGGSVKCKVPDCVNRAKTKGVCWSHGGGTICSFSQCGTIAVSNGVCWAHGGGKRCAVEGCSRPAYERTENLCTLHFDDKQKITLSGSAPRAA